MSTLHKKIILGAAFFFVLGFSHAYAATDDLVVVFEQTPLFSEANFMPGTVIDRDVKVTNNTAEAKDILTEAINQSDPDDFGDVLQMTIKEGATVLFDGTLSDFFDEGQVALSQIASGASATYIFSVSFESGADNSYQEKSLGFDILVGFKGDEGGGGESGGSSGEGGGGGGGGEGGGGANGPLFIPGLSITNESATTTFVGTASAVVQWVTSYKSTSRVIYDTASGVFNFNNPPNYGYSDSTAEFDTPANVQGVVTHTVTITGLTSGTTYYYRTVSHASPDSVSFEHSFTTTSTDDTHREMASENFFHESSPSKPVSGELALQTADGEYTPSENTNIEVTATHTNDSDNSEELPPSLLASLFASLSFSTGLVISFVLVIAITSFFIWRRSKRKRSC